MDLPKIRDQLRQEIAEATTELKPKKLGKRLKVIEAFIEFEQPARVDDPDRGAGDPAGAAAAGAARRRPLRHLRPQRPLPPRHQPQQPPEAADGAARARHHHPQREADAAGIGRRAVRQRPPRPRHHGRQQASAEVARRHAEGQAGPLPPEPARQARRLFGPLGDRGRPGDEAAPVRAAQEDGARAVQAVHLRAPAGARPGGHRQAGQEAGREGEARGLGRARRGHPRASGAAQPRADAASPRHPGLRAGADRGQGDPAASAGVRGLQRRLRRRPDGRARAAVAGSPARGARADDVDQQHPASRQRLAHHRAEPGHRARPLLPVDDARQGAGRGHAARLDRRGRARARRRPRHPARQGQGPLRRRRRGGQRGGRGARDHARPAAARRAAAEQARRQVRPRQPAADQEGHLRPDRRRLPRLRTEGDGDLLRPRHGPGLLPRLQGRHLVRQGRHGDPRHQGQVRRADQRPRARVRAAVQRRPHHPAREVQQGGGRLVEVHRPDRQGDDGPHLRGAARQGHRPHAAGQLGLHDGALRRARLREADAPARRHARPDDQAVGRDHRDADHLQLQGGTVACSSTSTRRTARARVWPIRR